MHVFDKRFHVDVVAVKPARKRVAKDPLDEKTAFQVPVRGLGAVDFDVRGVLVAQVCQRVGPMFFPVGIGVVVNGEENVFFVESDPLDAVSASFSAE